MVNLYSYYIQLTTATEHTITAGGRTFTLKIVQNDVAKEQYDIISRASVHKAAADPLYNVETKTYSKSYDYIDWYCDVDINNLNDLSELPFSLYKSSSSDRVSLATSRKATAEELYELRQTYIDNLRYQFKLLEGEDVLVTGVINNGSQYYLPDSNNIVWFHSVKDEAETLDDYFFIMLMVEAS